MKTLGMAVLLAASAFGQFGNVVFPGGGGPSAGGRFSGFGNVVFPGRGAAPVQNPLSITRPDFASRLGATVNPFGNSLGRRDGSRARGGGYVYVPYAYPVYAGPDPYIGGGSQQQPNITVIYPQQQPPVIINQTFTGPAPAEAQPEDQVRLYQAPVREPVESPASASTSAGGYLLAFKDHSIYSAVAYWVDGDTLHYFTSGNTHNQASVTLLDRDLTERLNRERGVDIRLPMAR